MITMLKINPLMDDGLNSCTHFLIASVADWVDCGYEMMYSDAWGFRFAPQGTKGIGIWERGDLGPRLHYENVERSAYLLRKFHGLEVNEVRGSHLKETMDLLHEQLGRQRPVLIMMDTYFLPWLDKYYRKIHSSHAILVIGIDDNGDLLCNDTRPFFQSPMFGARLTKEHFTEGYHNTYSTFDTVATEGCSLSECTRVLKQTALKMASKLEASASPIDAMREFGNHIEHHSIPLIDLEDFDGGNGIMLRAIRNIIRDRINFSHALKFVGRRFGVYEFIDISEKFSVPIENWNNLKLILYKSYISQDTDQKREKLASIIYENACIEEEIANRILDLKRSSE